MKTILAQVDVQLAMGSKRGQDRVPVCACPDAAPSIHGSWRGSVADTPSEGETDKVRQSARQQLSKLISARIRGLRCPELAVDNDLI